MISFVHKLLQESWFILWSAAPYIVLGLLLGGVIKTGLNAATIRRHLGGSGIKPIFKAALLGVPLPLCSCGVLPVGAALRKEGASRGATAAFLIATPESGVDSIAISYALLDPLLTVARPLAAFCTAFAAGLGMVFLDRKEKPQAFKEAPGACSCSSCDVPLREETGACCEAHQHHHHHDESPERKGHSAPALSLGRRLQEGFRYATGELWGHLAFPFALGVFLSGFLGALVPGKFSGAVAGRGASRHAAHASPRHSHVHLRHLLHPSGGGIHPQGSLPRSGPGLSSCRTCYKYLRPADAHQDSW